jgi:pseudaminic acid synthase
MNIDAFDLTGPHTFVVAELSANHGGDIEIAKETIRAAKRAGADAIKLQTYTADTLTIPSNKEDFKIKGTLWEGKYLYDLYKEAYTPWEWHKELFDTAKAENIICFSSPFDKTAVDLLEALNCPAYKIASFEIMDIPLISYAASKGKPIILSTGVADEGDIALAIEACKKENNSQIVVLKCTSSYPAKIEEADLRMIPDMAKRFDVITGLSDHTLGSLVPTLSVALGARMIEKHFILDKSVGGPDASFSMNESEFKAMVDIVRDAEKALGKIDYSLTESKKKSRMFARSLYVVNDMKKGEIVSEENVRSIRPGYGLHPKHLKQVLNKKVNRDIEKGERFALSMIDSPNEHYAN